MASPSAALLCLPMRCLFNRPNRWCFLGGLLAALVMGACVAPFPLSQPALPTAASTAALTATPTATWTPAPKPTFTPTPPPPSPVLEIPLTGPSAASWAEFSGMAWYGDHLVLLPQYPSRFGAGDGLLFVLDRAEINAFVDGRLHGPLTPRPLPIDAPGLRGHFPGYEGFESIVFDGERVYLTVEASPTDGMQGWIVAGEVEPDLSVLHIDVHSALAIEPQADLGNLSDEAMVLSGMGDSATLLTIYEANGRLINRSPVAHRFAADLTELDSWPFPSVEYRITDATRADENGRFWAINYFYPGDVMLQAGFDPLLRRAVQSLPQVERLVEFELSDDAVRFSGRPPLFLDLLEGEARNWEGIVRLDDRGFLLVTDTHPRTILAFVAMP